MSIESNDIKAGPAHLEHKLSPQLSGNLSKSQRLQILVDLIKTIKGAKNKVSVVYSFCLGYLSHEAGYYEAALAWYEQVAHKWTRGEPAFYARYVAGIIMQNLDYPWPQVEEKFLSAFQALPTRGESLLRVIDYYQSKQLWPIAYLYSKFAMEQFYDNLPLAGNWDLDKSLYNWKILDIHKVSCYYVQKMDEATAAYSTLCRLISANPQSFLSEDITRIARQKFLFPGSASYEKDRPQYHLQ